MMEMLKRFEDEQAGGEGLPSELDDEEGETDELAQKLSGVDLGMSLYNVWKLMIESIDTNALFHLLPPEHRGRFLAALKDPESEETKALLELATKDQLGSEEESDLAIPDEMPWWESPEIMDEDDDEEMIYADIPDLISDQAVIGIKPPDGVGSKLAYNALAIWYATPLYQY